MSLRLRSRVVLVALVAGIALAGGLGLVVLQRRALAAHWLGARLGPDAVFEVRELDANGIALAGIRAALPDRGVASLAVEELRLGYTLRGLWRGELGELAVRGVRANVAWPAPVSSEESAPDTDALRWLGLLSRLSLDDVDLRVAVSGVEIGVRARASLARSAEGVVAGEAQLSAAGPAERAELELRIDSASPERAAGRVVVKAEIDEGTRLPLRGRLEGELAVAADPQGLELRVLQCPRVQLGQLAWNGSPWLRRAVDTCIQPGDAPLLRARLAAEGAALEADLRLAPFELALGPGADVLAEARVERAGVRLRREPGGSLHWQIDGDGAWLRLPRAGVELRNVGVTSELGAEGELRVELTRAELRDRASPARFAPFQASAEARRSTPDGPIALALDARAGSALALRAVGQHDPTEQRGELALVPASHAAAALLAQLPILRRWIDGARGELGVAGTLAWRAQAVEIQSELTARGLDLATPWGVYTGLSGSVPLRGPGPWRTAGPVALEVARIRHGVVWTDARVRFALQPDGVLALESAAGKIFGGSMQASGAYRPAGAESAFQVRLDAVDVRALLAYLELPGVVATGALQGSLPLALGKGGLEIRNGELVARNGILQYRPEAASGAAAAAGSSELRLTLEALRDVRYDVLRIRMDGPVRGKPSIVVYLEGVNPTLERGTPVEVTLNLDANLAELLRFPALPGLRR